MYKYKMVKKILIISVRGYMFLKYLHWRLIFISIGADNLSTQHHSGIRMYVCGPTLVASAEQLFIYFRLSPSISVYPMYVTKKITRYIKNIEIYRSSPVGMSAMFMFP